MGSTGQPTRRQLLEWWAAGAVMVGLGDVEAALAAGRRGWRAIPHGAGTTLTGTIVRGPVINGGGYRRLVSGPAEPHIVREDLGVRARPGRATGRPCLLSFVQFTDTHLVDAQSPARVEFLDRYSDGVGAATPFSGAYRPNEPLGVQVSESIVRAVRRVGVGPASGRPYDFAICTGDTVDNCHHNEVRWIVDLLDGVRVTPDSGAGDRWEGVQDAVPDTYDVHYWHPDGTPDGKADDIARAQFGFPVAPGMLSRARAAVDCVGLGLPWYAVYGNHDGLLQGNIPPGVGGLSEVATGSAKVVGLPAGISPQDIATGDATALVASLTAGPARAVTADPGRRLLSRRETVAEYFSTAGVPVGHGFTDANRRDGTAYYAFDAGLVRAIVLDTVNPNGYADGSLDGAQFQWLLGELARGGRRQRLMVVFSHHTSATMSNGLTGTVDTTSRVLGETVLGALLDVPNVIAWVNGHTHVNQIVARRRTTGGGGLWEISTASHIDFPQQARLLEICDNRDGTLSIFGTVVDAAAPLSWPTALDSVEALASLSRELAANDYQERPAAAGMTGAPDGRRGKIEDRNVELLVAAPFTLPSAHGRHRRARPARALAS